MLLTPSHSQSAELMSMLFHPLLAAVKVTVPLNTRVRLASFIHDVGTLPWEVIPR